MSTEHDKAVLNSILNPFFPVGGFDGEDNSNLKDEIDEVTKEVLDARKMERDAILLAESGKVNEAIKILNQAIKIAPQLSSLYNNRAQVHRLNNDTVSALDDLNLALMISKGVGRSACQAFCQRGLIYKKNGEDEKAEGDFKKAAQLGSPFAKMYLVQSNPYAALCNSMLSQIMKKVKG